MLNKTRLLYLQNYKLKIKDYDTKRIFKNCKDLQFAQAKNGFISITYAYILSNNAISTQRTVEIEDKGGALTSLYIHLV